MGKLTIAPTHLFNLLSRLLRLRTEDGKQALWTREEKEDESESGRQADSRLTADNS